MQSGFSRLADFPVPFWLALFVEGTRFTQAKLQAAQEYAASRGLPIPRNILLPRTKVNDEKKFHQDSKFSELESKIWPEER